MKIICSDSDTLSVRMHASRLQRLKKLELVFVQMFKQPVQFQPNAAIRSARVGVIGTVCEQKPAIHSAAAIRLASSVSNSA